MQENNYEYVLSGVAAPDFILRFCNGIGGLPDRQGEKHPPLPVRSEVQRYVMLQDGCVCPCYMRFSKLRNENIMKICA